jgi:hypothetical protein
MHGPPQASFFCFYARCPVIVDAGRRYSNFYTTQTIASIAQIVSFLNYWLQAANNQAARYPDVFHNLELSPIFPSYFKADWRPAHR